MKFIIIVVVIAILAFLAYKFLLAGRSKRV